MRLGARCGTNGGSNKLRAAVKCPRHRPTNGTHSTPKTANGSRYVSSASSNSNSGRTTIPNGGNSGKIYASASPLCLS